jgi:replication-associated recombination protein RarA
VSGGSLWPRGHCCGGQPANLNANQAALARWLKANGETASTICWTPGIGRTTLYRYLAESVVTFANAAWSPPAWG